MNIMYLLLFLGGVFLVGVILFFAWTVRNETYDYSEQISLLPLDDD